MACVSAERFIALPTVCGKREIDKATLTKRVHLLICRLLLLRTLLQTAPVYSGLRWQFVSHLVGVSEKLREPGQVSDRLLVCRSFDSSYFRVRGQYHRAVAGGSLQ